MPTLTQIFLAISFTLGAGILAAAGVIAFFAHYQWNIEKRILKGEHR